MVLARCTSALLAALACALHANHEHGRRHLLGLEHVEDVAGAGQRTVVEGEIDRAIRGNRGKSKKQYDQHGKVKRRQHREYPCPIATGRHFRVVKFAAYARLPRNTVNLAFLGARATSHSRAFSCGIGKAME